MPASVEPPGYSAMRTPPEPSGRLLTGTLLQCSVLRLRLTWRVSLAPEDIPVVTQARRAVDKDTALAQSLISAPRQIHRATSLSLLRVLEEEP
ncbi:hypothetical protein EYF80_057273 [Liparis tanakae]|uniref:Uncharacterized protein n=1 Tax=Liparis tanakae TaxID=230148 RepID=A0A4Z2EUE8_9TELE|nr:hypothetical protein EYF80_057273 [Liparis tanakae]